MQNNTTIWKKIGNSILVSGGILGLAYGYTKLFALWLPVEVVEYHAGRYNVLFSCCVLLSLVTWLGIYNLIMPHVKTVQPEKKDENE